MYKINSSHIINYQRISIDLRSLSEFKQMMDFDGTWFWTRVSTLSHILLSYFGITFSKVTRLGVTSSWSDPKHGTNFTLCHDAYGPRNILCSGRKNVPSSPQSFFKTAWRNGQRWLKLDRLYEFFFLLVRGPCWRIRLDCRALFMPTHAPASRASTPTGNKTINNAEFVESLQ